MASEYNLSLREAMRLTKRRGSGSPPCTRDPAVLVSQSLVTEMGSCCLNVERRSRRGCREQHHVNPKGGYYDGGYY
jgi:hypothetical protein